MFTIKTNNVPRNIIYGYELPAKYRKEFDYLKDEDYDSHCFFRYRDHVYDLDEFSRVIPQGSTRWHPMECDDPDFTGWDGYLSDSFFSGILIRWAKDTFTGEIDTERVIVGVYFS